MGPTLSNWPYLFVFACIEEKKEAGVVTMSTAMPNDPIGRFVFECTICRHKIVAWAMDQFLFPFYPLLFVPEDM